MIARLSAAAVACICLIICLCDAASVSVDRAEALVAVDSSADMAGVDKSPTRHIAKNLHIRRENKQHDLELEPEENDKELLTHQEKSQHNLTQEAQDEAKLSVKDLLERVSSSASQREPETEKEATHQESQSKAKWFNIPKIKITIPKITVNPISAPAITWPKITVPKIHIPIVKLKWPDPFTPPSSSDVVPSPYGDTEIHACVEPNTDIMQWSSTCDSLTDQEVNGPTICANWFEQDSISGADPAGSQYYRCTDGDTTLCKKSEERCLR